MAALVVGVSHLATGVDGLLGWLDVLVVVGVLIAVLMGREARPSGRTG